MIRRAIFKSGGNPLVTMDELMSHCWGIEFSPPPWIGELTLKVIDQGADDTNAVSTNQRATVNTTERTDDAIYPDASPHSKRRSKIDHYLQVPIPNRRGPIGVMRFERRTMHAGGVRRDGGNCMKISPASVISPTPIR